MTDHSKRRGSSFILLDGGMGRELMRRGASIREPLWSANALYENPALVEDIHASYIDVGADVLTLNTYGIKPNALRQIGRDMDFDFLFRTAASAAKAAASRSENRRVRMAASLPPLATSYRPDQVLTDAQMTRDYDRYVHMSRACDVDLILGETLSTLAEARALLNCSRTSGIETWIGFTVDDRGILRSGESLPSAMSMLRDLGASAVLINCSTVEATTLALQSLSSMSLGLPIGAYANAFAELPQDYAFEKDGPHPTRAELTPKTYALHAAEWISLGASIIGCCCGVGPAHIAALRPLMPS